MSRSSFSIKSSAAEPRQNRIRPPFLDSPRRGRVVSGGMPRHGAVAERMADAVVKRLVTRKVAEIKNEAAARAAVRQVVLDNLTAEEKLEEDARKLLLEHAKQIKDSAADYRQLLGKVKEKLARERGFVL
ncbi:MAG TPA: hypothetical protein DDZ42_20820 [Candidatus Rokubacteria bacterium]|nr:hypothetical protein [Candidatus Rokubacteria bacterium]